MDYRPEFQDLNFVHYIGMSAALISAAIHLYLAPQIGLNTLGLSFGLAGLGFIAGITLVAVDYRRKLVYLAGIPFTAGQIVIWYYLNRVPLESFLRAEPFLDFVDKIAQIALIIVLAYLYWKE